MKRKLVALSRRNVTALRKHLKQGPRASLQPAHDLGRQAAALDLETLDEVRIHEVAPATLEAASSGDGIIQRAEILLPRLSPRLWRRIVPRKLLPAQWLFYPRP